MGSHFSVKMGLGLGPFVLLDWYTVGEREMDAGKTILCPWQTTRWQLKYCVDVTDRFWGLPGILVEIA